MQIWQIFSGSLYQAPGLCLGVVLVEIWLLSSELTGWQERKIGKQNYKETEMSHRTQLNTKFWWWGFRRSCHGRGGVWAELWRRSWMKESMKRCAHTQCIHRDEQSPGCGGVSTLEPIKVGGKKSRWQGAFPQGPRRALEWNGDRNAITYSSWILSNPWEGSEYGCPRESQTPEVPLHLCDLSSPGTMIPTLQMKTLGLKLRARLINGPRILACSW